MGSNIEQQDRADVLKRASLNPKSFCPSCWHWVKVLLTQVQIERNAADKLVECLEELTVKGTVDSEVCVEAIKRFNEVTGRAVT